MSQNEDANEGLTFEPPIETMRKLITIEAMLTVSLNAQADILAAQSNRDKTEVRNELWGKVNSARVMVVEDFEASVRERSSRENS